MNYTGEKCHWCGNQLYIDNEDGIIHCEKCFYEAIQMSYEDETYHLTGDTLIIINKSEVLTIDKSELKNELDTLEYIPEIYDEMLPHLKTIHNSLKSSDNK